MTVSKKKVTPAPVKKKPAVKKTPTRDLVQEKIDAQVDEIVKDTKPAAKKAVEKVAPAVMHHKVLTIILSVGSEDRSRSLEEFEVATIAALKKTGARNIMRSGGYYILDGKVCLEQDFDPKTQNFKPGATAPAWAGGPMGNAAVLRGTGGEQKGTQPEPVPRTSAAALADLHENTEWGRKRAEERSRLAVEKSKKAAATEDDDLEEFGWDAEDIHDTEKMERVADENTAAAIIRLKSGKSIRIKKKVSTAVVETPKRVVKRATRKDLPVSMKDPDHLPTVAETMARLKNKKPVVRRKK